MKRYLFALAMIVALSVGCSSDESSIVGYITFDNKGMFVSGGGESMTTYFTPTNITYIEIDGQPDDWDIDISLSNCSITVTAPSSASYGDAELVIISGYTDGDYIVRKSFYVGVKEHVSLDDVQSNSMIITEGDKVYTLNPLRKGELSTEDLEAPTKCEVVWRNDDLPVQYVYLNAEGQLSFYVPLDVDDVDEDGDTTDLIEGNALVYSQDANGKAIWSWHIWVSDEEVGEFENDGATFMDRNLGALDNNNSSEDEIATSYGLYYQWGRKDPFIYPGSYNGAGGVDADLLDQSEYTFELCYTESDSDVGTMSYATTRPWYYIISSTGDQPDYDWMWTGGDADLWGGETSTKSVNDPCPMGWELPTSAMLSSLAVDSGQSLTSASYGATLSGGNLFMGLGFRTYVTGRLQNINTDYEPWTGYYWSRDASAGKAKYMQLMWLDSGDGTGEATLTVGDSYRANGMQVRCVRQ